MMREGIWDSLKRWRKALNAKLAKRPFFDIKKARRNFYMLLDNHPTLPASQNGEIPIVVSLTTFPSRIRSTGWTLLSLFLQEKLPNKIILNLSTQEFPDKNLPQEIYEFQKLGLEIAWNEERTLSYLKIMPTLQRFADSIIITCDDDQYYDPTWLKKLYESYQAQPELIHAHRVHRVSFENGALLPYNKWRHGCDNMPNPSYYNFATGVGGVLYPPRCFYADVLDKELYTKLCPKADDIWLWGMEVLNNKQILLINNPTRSLPTMVTQKVSLLKDNVYLSLNDKQLQALCAHYPEIMQKLNAESPLTR